MLYRFIYPLASLSRTRLDICLVTASKHANTGSISCRKQAGFLLLETKKLRKNSTEFAIYNESYAEQSFSIKEYTGKIGRLDSAATSPICQPF